MGSVQSEIKCSKCKYNSAMEEFYYKTGEIYIYCERCGYFYSNTGIIDEVAGKEIKKQVAKLIADDKINEAIDAAKHSGWIRHTQDKNGKKITTPIKKWPDKEKLQHLKKLNYDNYFKMDDGKIVYEEKEGGGYGSYRYQPKKGIGSVCGSLEEGGKDKIIAWVKKNKKTLKEAYITYNDEEDGWVRMNIMTENRELVRNNFHVFDEGDK